MLGEPNNKADADKIKEKFLIIALEPLKLLYALTFSMSQSIVFLLKPVWLEFSDICNISSPI